MLSEELLERLSQQGVKADKRQVVGFLLDLKQQQESSETNAEKRAVIERMTGAFTKLSITAYQAQSSSE